MAGPTLIQIKRSLTTAAGPTLANGELAYTANGDVLYIGSNAVTSAIAGKRVPGVLTANQAIVTNSINHIDTIKIGNTIANIVLSATGILLSNTDAEGNTITITTPNTTEKGGQYYLKADGSWSTVSAGSAAPAGANTQVQYNDSGVTAGGAGFTYDKASNNVTVGNGVITGTFTQNGSGFFAAANVVLDTTKLFIGNSTVNAFANSLIFKVADTTGIANLTPGLLQIQANVSLDSTRLAVGNTTVNLVANSILVKVADTTGAANLTPASLAVQANVLLDSVKLFIGNTTANLTQNSVIVSVANSTGISNQQPTQFVTGNTTTSTTVGVAAVTVGNSTFNAVANSTTLKLSNSTAVMTCSIPAAAQVTAANYYLASDSTWKQVVASGTLDGLTDVTITTAANNQVIVFDNAAVQWVNKTVGNGFSFSSQAPAVLAGVGLLVNVTGVNVLANNGIIANATGTWVGGANGISVTAAGVNVLGNNGISVNSTGTWVVSANGLTTTAAGVNVLANNGIVANSTGTFANIGSTLAFTSGAIGVNTNLSITDLTLSGNLNVTGTLTTVDATNLVVNDSIISLARNNAADTLDIGMYGQYNDGTERFTGLIWDTTTDVWELFANTIVEPTTTVDIAQASYTHSTLYSWHKAGWGTGTFVANATGTTITANSTWAVAITGNTLSLSTPLPGTSGGTGLATSTDQAILKGNTTNGYTSLAIGATGTVLQNVGGALAYDTLDGGTF